MDGDELRAWRQRMVELVAWFRDPARLIAAEQARHGDPGWAHALDVAVDLRLRGGPPLQPVQPTEPARRLFELEVLDRAAHLRAGASGGVAPPMRFAVPTDGAEPPESCYLVRLHHARRPLASRQAGLLANHLRYHAVIPTVIATNSARLPVKVERAAPWSEAPGDRVVVATTSFGDAARLVTGAGGAFVSVPSATARRNALIAAVAAARARRVDILVVPELTVPPTERDEVIDHVRDHDGPALLVPGSFHETIAAADGTTRVVHRAVLVDRRGNQLLAHHKIALFGAFGGAFGVEQVEAGNQVTVLVTPLGLVALAICKDFCDDDVQTVWQKLQPEWLLVPAYGPGASAHGTAAERIARMVGTVTVLAHEALHSQRLEDDPDATAPPGARRSANHSFVHADARAKASDYRHPEDFTPFAPELHVEELKISDGYMKLADDAAGN